MARFLSWALTLLLFGSFVVVAGLALRARLEAGRGMPAYSVHSQDARGLGEAARLVRKMGREPVAVSRPIRQLRSAGTPRLLVLVEPSPGAEIEEGEAKGLLRWVEDGNTLVFCSRTWSTLHAELGVSLRVEGVGQEEEWPEEVVPAEAGAYTAEVGRLIVDRRSGIEPRSGLPLWWVGDRAGAVLYRRGLGRIVLIADPGLFTWAGLTRQNSQQDNAVFLRNLVLLHARDGQVYFDEYHHGFRSGGGFWGYLRFHEQGWMLLPALAAAVAACWTLAVRLGPAVPRSTGAQADAVDYASALARIYQRTGVRGLLGRGLARDFLHDLTRALRIRRNALPAEILSAWRHRRPDDGSARRLANLLKGVNELRQANVTDRRLLFWSRAFDEFLAEQAGSAKEAKPVSSR